MAWINTDGEDPELEPLLERVRDPRTGQVDHIMRIHARHPAGLAAHHELYRAVMRGTASLRTVDRELIALVVSGINGCHYWTVHHRRGLRRLLRDDALAERVEADFESAGLDPRRRALLDYAAKLTRTPASIVEADIEGLRAVGLSDTDVLHVAEVVGYYAYVNRIADGLGVELEPEGG